jgi:hypothetical protein
MGRKQVAGVITAIITILALITIYGFIIQFTIADLYLALLVLVPGFIALFLARWIGRCGWGIDSPEKSEFMLALSGRISRWSISLTTIFAAIVVVLSLLESVYRSANPPIVFLPWFVRKLTAEIFSGVIMQLLSLLFGLAFTLGKTIAPMRRAGVLVFTSQVVFFLSGLIAFLLFSIEMFRSAIIP